MITKMKKLTFLVYHKEYEAFLAQIRELGVVHVVERQCGEMDDRVDPFARVARLQPLPVVIGNPGISYQFDQCPLPILLQLLILAQINQYIQSTLRVFVHILLDFLPVFLR